MSPFFSSGSSFANQLQGQDFNNALGLAGSYGSTGQSGINNAYNAYKIPVDSFAPYFQSGSNLGLGLMDQSLKNYDVSSGRGLESLRTIDDISNRYLDRLDKQGTSSYDRNNQFLNQQLGNSQSYLGQQQNFGLGQSGQENDLLKAYMGGEYGLGNTNLSGQYQLEAAKQAADAAKSAGTWSGVGNLAGGLSGPIIDLLKKLFTTKPVPIDKTGGGTGDGDIWSWIFGNGGDYGMGDGGYGGGGGDALSNRYGGYGQGMGGYI